MPNRTQQRAMALGPNTGARFLKSFTGSELGFNKQDRRVSLEKVPTQLRDGRYVHITHLLAVINMDVDTDGSSTIVAERLLAHFSNLRMSMLGGQVDIYPGDIDLRVPTFIEKVVRKQRDIWPSMPDDNEQSSAADAFSDDLQILIPLGATGYDAEGRSRRDGGIWRGFFTDVGGRDDLLLDVLAKTAGIGGEDGVTLQNLDKLEFYSVERYDRYPGIDPIWALDYWVSDQKHDVIRPVAQEANQWRTEFCGFRQQEEDTEALDFSNAGNLTVGHGHEKIHVARSMTDMGYIWSLLYHPSRPALSARHQPVTGYLPLVFNGPVSDRAEWGRTPVDYTLTSLGSSRDEVRVLQSEIHTWNDPQIAAAAEALGVQPGRLRELRETVKTTHIDPALLPRRVIVR